MCTYYVLRKKGVDAGGGVVGVVQQFCVVVVFWIAREVQREQQGAELWMHLENRNITSPC